MDNFWDYGPDYTSPTDTSGDWGGYDQIYVDGNTGGSYLDGNFWDDWSNFDYSGSEVPMYLDPNTAPYEPALWLPETQQFGVDSLIDPTSLQGLMNFGGYMPTDIGTQLGIPTMDAANSYALATGMPFRADYEIAPEDAFRLAYMTTGDPVAAALAKREAEATAEERLLSDTATLGQSMAAWAQDPRGTALLDPSFKPSQSFRLEDGTVVGDVASGADIQNPYEYVASGDSTYIVDRNTGQLVGYLDEGGQPVSYQEARISGASTPAAASNVVAGKLLGAAADKLLSPKEQAEAEKAKALARMYSDYNKQAAAKEAYQNSGVGKAMTGLQGALAIAQALNGGNKGATTSARSNQGQAFSPSYQGATAPKTLYASGGKVQAKGGLLNLAERMASMLAQQKGLIPGNGGGQDDIVDIKAAPGEYVMDAEIVSALGDGNNEEGARKLDQMRVNVRKHKRTGGLTAIPPKAKAPEQYMKKGK